MKYSIVCTWHILPEFLLLFPFLRFISVWHAANSMNRWNLSLRFASRPSKLYNKCMRRPRIRVLAFTHFLFNFIFVFRIDCCMCECWMLNSENAVCHTGLHCTLYTFYDTQIHHCTHCYDTYTMAFDRYLLVLLIGFSTAEINLL